MFTVECPGCRSSYQVDERRIPVAGLRMRCPKCSNAFVVDKPGVSAAGVPPENDLPAQVEKPALPATATGAKPLGGKPAIPARTAAGVPPTAPSALGAKPAGVPPTAPSALGTKPASALGTKPAGTADLPATAPSDLGTKPASTLGAKPASTLGTKPASALGAKPAGVPPTAPSALGTKTAGVRPTAPSALGTKPAGTADLPATAPSALATKPAGTADLPATAPSALATKPASALGTKPAGVPPTAPSALGTKSASAKETPTLASETDDLLPAVPSVDRAQFVPTHRAPPLGATRPKPAELKPSAPVDLPTDEVDFPEYRRSPTVKMPRQPAAMFEAELSSEELPIDAGLPAPVVKQHAPTEPMLPIASNLNDYDSDGSLPVALGAKSSVGKPLAHPTQGRVPQPGQPPSASVENAFEMDLPGNFEPSAYSERKIEGSIDVGLPEVSTRRKTSPLGLELDLPSTANRDFAARNGNPKSVPPLLEDFEFELPSPVKARKEADSSWSDLNQGASLPDLSRNFEAEARLPAVADARLPAVADAGLPAVATTGIGLPSVPGASFTTTKTLSGTGSSPAPALGSNPPPMASIPPTEIPELDLGWGQSPSLPPASALSRGGVDSLPPMFGGSSKVDVSTSALMGSENPDAGNSLPPILGNTPATAVDFTRNARSSGVNLERALEPLNSSGSRGTSSLPVDTRLESKAKSTAVGGTSYGEVNFDVPEGGLAVETDSDLAHATRNSSAGLEFGAVPQSVEMPNIALAGGGEPLPQSSRRATSIRSKGQSGKPSRFAPKFVAAMVAVTLVGGGLALTVLPDIGPFGAFFIIDQVNRKENESLVRRYVDNGRLVLAKDDYSGVEPLVQELDRARRTKERLKSLSVYASYFSFVTELRHGAKPPIHARADVILNELVERKDLPYYGLAQAARAAVDGNLARARRAIDAELVRDPRNVDAVVLSAEITLLEHRQVEALQQWQMADKLAPSARTSFGLARTFYSLSRFEEATVESRKTLERNPTHIGAELLLGRIALDVVHDAEEAERRVKSALTRTANASLNDFVQAKTLNGDVHLLRSRISLAETSFQEAIAKEPKSGSALRGLGETLYRAGRFSEALARFEAGVQAAPDQVDAAVGVAKSQLALERVREAETLLARLRQGNPKNYAVNYWYAKASEASGNRDEAEKAYEVAIELGGTDPVVVDAYVGLALVKNQQGRREEAQKVLAKAQEKLPKLPRIYEAMGQLALSEGRYAAAVEQFKAALERSPTDVGVKFRLGVALRKNRDFDAAGKAFDEVAVVDRDYPGLALERGQLFEASGQTEEALRAFESALAKAPTDPDLMLRVGCGKVTAGRPEQAEELLKKVLEQRPTSAETHHCLGRAQLLEGSNLALALRTLERAVELDPHRAEYLLYVGWAANEAGRVAQAEQALKKALELDQGLGDAYWQRGILRYRQGAVKDAVVDLTRALELRPGRYEAHASLADAYYDLGLESKALEEWQKATSAQPDNATWAFRYGKLLQAAHRDAEAKGSLEKSIELTEKLTSKPRWLWEAHHLLARVIGLQPAAVKHWQKFLELSPRDNVYRDDAKVALTKLGQPWTGD